MKSKTVYCQQCGAVARTFKSANKEKSNEDIDRQGDYICKTCEHSRTNLAEMESAEISLHDCYHYQDSDF